MSKFNIDNMIEKSINKKIEEPADKKKRRTELSADYKEIPRVDWNTMQVGTYIRILKTDGTLTIGGFFQGMEKTKNGEDSLSMSASNFSRRSWKHKLSTVDKVYMKTTNIQMPVDNVCAKTTNIQAPVDKLQVIGDSMLFNVNYETRITALENDLSAVKSDIKKILSMIKTLALKLP